MNIISRFVRLGSQTDAGGILCEIIQFAPYQRRNQDTNMRIIHLQHNLKFPVVHLHLKASAQRKYHHLAGTVSMIAPHVPVLDIVSPEHTLNAERNMPLALAEGKRASLVINKGILL